MRWPRLLPASRSRLSKLYVCYQAVPSHFPQCTLQSACRQWLHGTRLRPGLALALQPALVHLHVAQAARRRRAPARTLPP